MKKLNVREKIKKFPQTSGVYFFLSANKNILYIGKATNLRIRVQSYFSTRNASCSDVDGREAGVTGRSEWIGLMVSQVSDIDFEQTDSVLEALILESNLIKKHQPKYNTLEKDDKSFSYFVVTKEEYPRILIMRATDLSHKISNFQFPISNKFSIIKSSKPKTKIQNFKFEIQNSRVYGPYTSKKQMEVALKIIRRIFPFHSGKQKTEKGCLDFQIGMCPGPYAGSISKIDYKKNIRGIEMILQGKKKSLLGKIEKEMELFSQKQEFEKAAVLRNKIFALKHIRDVALIGKDDCDFLNPEFEIDSKFKIQNSKFLRIEAYDISNISGQHAVGSMVVFRNGEPEKSQYRKFKIKTVEGSNDVAMMREVLSRRFRNDWPASTREDDHSSTRGWAKPDLIFLDGGLGHLNMAKDLFGTLGLNIPIISVAKGKDRKKLDIKIAFIHNTKYIIHDTSNVKSRNKKLEMDEILRNNLLIKAIMDEAHRFAITFHRKIRRKNALAE